MTPVSERDACGVGFVADLYGRRTHEILSQGLSAVANLSHRGALAADARTGDGAGVLTQIPYALLRRDMVLHVADEDIAVAVLFLPTEADVRQSARSLVEQIFALTELECLGWRLVPVDVEALGEHARATAPFITQAVVARPDGISDDGFDRLLYLCRRRIEHAAARERLSVYVPSLSRRTIIYKGLFSSPQLARFYTDLTDPIFETALAVFHQRYSTNTFPSWQLSQPFRFLAHNGEINTLQGNVNWMRAREASLSSEIWNKDSAELLPIIQEGGSDSAILDNVLELLVMSGRDLAHVLMMLVPEAWEGNQEMDETVRAFYEYHACLTEPWDGPASLAFSDGIVAGAALDRNGLRPARYLVTGDGLIVMASEAGVLDIAEERVVEKGRLGPGQMIVVDTSNHRLLRNDDLKRAYAGRHPYGEWLRANMSRFDNTRTQESSNGVEVEPRESASDLLTAPNLLTRQLTFGFTREDIDRILHPMAEDGKDPVFSMGDDTPAAVLSARPRLLYHYFRQRFAQVTNPPIDPLRERLVMSLATYLGPRPTFLGETAEHARLLHLPSPILLPEELNRVRSDAPFTVHTLHARFRVAEGTEGFARGFEALIEDACRAALEAGILIISDAGIDEDFAPLPMLLAVSAVHHELIRRGLRMRVNLIAETGEARDIHQVACLIGYGCAAVCPYLALQTIETVAHNGATNGDSPYGEDGSTRVRRAAYRRAVEAGLLKIMSKMGISTLTGYLGAQIFEAVGLDDEVIDRYFPGTPSRIRGAGLAAIAEEALARHEAAFGTKVTELQEAGFVRFRREGEYHAFNPFVVKALHRTARNGSGHENGNGVAKGAANGAGDLHRAFAALVERRPPTTLRDLLEFVPQSPVPLEEVEPAEEIVKRFVISAMSHGALGREAHETLAVAANRIGARSNSGEGGEDPSRYRPRAIGEWSNSRVKQVASARFGVTPEYLLSADELEIKMAQGSKPGEGGQLPGHKVSEEIARIRRAQPGITLISPPPHHDIYSIEDLAQLIYDLKRINDRARVAVKLVAEAGVGTIAAGVAKAFADTIQISGHDGGTGASPLDSIKHAGVPWELGLAETQQVLVESGLRGRVRLRVDGGFKTGRDVVLAALLGADEFGFGSAAVVALGCVMARQCHLNTCPVGIATQREDLRLRFSGTADMVIAYLMSVGEQARAILASLGARSLDEVIGRVDLLRQRRHADGKAGTVDLGFVVRDPEVSRQSPRRNHEPRNDRQSDNNMDARIIEEASDALAGPNHVRLAYPIRNTYRTVGAGLAGQIVRRYGDGGLPEGSITIHLHGAAGQSFGAFSVHGMTLALEGEANDYVAKGMAGGEIIIRPPATFSGASHHNVIMGNTVLYGATGGRLFAAGRAGERFAVRNSGAVAVVEGVGDHGCEYMTGGTVVVLGEVGRNFAAGMTGGVAFVLDEQGRLTSRYNPEHVRLERLKDPEDEAHLLTLIDHHARATGSARARDILARWDFYGPIMWRVAPQPIADRGIPAALRREDSSPARR